MLASKGEVETASICIGALIPGWTPGIVVVFEDNWGVGMLGTALDAEEVARDLGSKFGNDKGTSGLNTCHLALFWQY